MELLAAVSADRYEVQTESQGHRVRFACSKLGALWSAACERISRQLSGADAVTDFQFNSTSSIIRFATCGVSRSPT
jgi:hypothetical protein